MTYQWFKDNQAIANATGKPMLILTLSDRDGCRELSCGGKMILERRSLVEQQSCAGGNCPDSDC